MLPSFFRVFSGEVGVEKGSELVDHGIAGGALFGKTVQHRIAVEMLLYVAQEIISRQVGGYAVGGIIK